MNKKIVEADMKIATLNKQKAVVRVGQKQYNLQCKQQHGLSVLYF